MDNTTISKQASALRDFFASVDAEDLREAATAISRTFNLPVNKETDWREVEYDFNRLFVGPAAVPAPPYASAYAEDTLLMGKSTLEVRDAYRAIGLEVPEMNSTPDDHLAFELDAVAALCGAEVRNETGEQVQTWLVSQHMSGWVPRFASAVKDQPSVSEPVFMAVEALISWLESAKDEIEYKES